MICLSRDSRAGVDAMTEAALKGGATDYVLKERLGRDVVILVMREGRIRASLDAEKTSLDEIKLDSMSNER